MSDRSEAIAAVKKTVEWWITDLCYKPPEVTTTAYFNYMADNIAEAAVEICLGPEAVARDRSSGAEPREDG